MRRQQVNLRVKLVLWTITSWLFLLLEQKFLFCNFLSANLSELKTPKKLLKKLLFKSGGVVLKVSAKYFELNIDKNRRSRIFEQLRKVFKVCYRSDE